MSSVTTKIIDTVNVSFVTIRSVSAYDDTGQQLASVALVHLFIGSK